MYENDEQWSTLLETIDCSLLPEVCVGLNLAGFRVNKDSLHRGASDPEL